MDPNFAATSALGIPIHASVSIQQSEEKWMAYMRNFYKACKASVDGLRMEDAQYIALNVTSHRSRAPLTPSPAACFPDNTERDLIIQMLFDRVNEECGLFRRICEGDMRLVCSNVTWAALQVADMDRMRALHQELLMSETPDFFKNIKQIVTDWSILFKAFFAKTLSDYQKEMGTPQPGHVNISLNRNTKKAKSCLVRDNFCCIVTRDPHPQACHIYPFSTWNHQYNPSVRAALAQIWGGKRAGDLLGRLHPEKQGAAGIDHLSNMISLSASMHEAWEAGDFAFLPSLPVHGTIHSITLTIYWMKKWSAGSLDKDMGGAILVSASKTLSNASRPGYPPARAVNLATNTPVVDGDQFTIFAAKKEDLPDYDILMLQWDMIRMASLCGGAEPDDDEDSNGSDTDQEAQVIAEE